MTGLTLINIQKMFGNTTALHDVSFNIRKHEILAVLGPSGCGKSTILNIIAGLDDPDKGEITWDRVSLKNTPSHKRDFGLMFQDYLLFPHKNVYANVSFGLEMAGWSADKIADRVTDVLDMVNLNGYAQRDVSTLSGGEQQRVALARSLAPKPRLLMLDEPLGALDRALREHLLDELAAILRKMQQTALYVTHDQEEAFMLADRVVVMDQGTVAQIGTPQEIYRNPSSEYVARFLGLGNILMGYCQDGYMQTGIGKFKISDLESSKAVEEQSSNKSAKIPILLRPDAMRLDGIGTHYIDGVIQETKFRGSLNRVAVQINEQTLNFEFPASTLLPETGISIQLSFYPAEAIQILS